MRIGSFEFNLGELAGSMGDFSRLLPLAIVGPIMLLVGIELSKFARDLRLNRDLVPVAVTVVGPVAVNMAAGFVAGLIVHCLLVLHQGGATDGER